MITGPARDGLRKILELVACNNYNDLNYISEKIVGKGVDEQEKTQPEKIHDILFSAAKPEEILHLQKVNKACLMKYLRNEGIAKRDDEKKAELLRHCKQHWFTQEFGDANEETFMLQLDRLDEEMATEISNIVEHYREKKKLLMENWRSLASNTFQSTQLENSPSTSNSQQLFPLTPDNHHHH